jgi:hypothetical protein
MKTSQELRKKEILEAMGLKQSVYQELMRTPNGCLYVLELYRRKYGTLEGKFFTTLDSTFSNRISSLPDDEAETYRNKYNEIIETSNDAL